LKCHPCNVTFVSKDEYDAHIRWQHEPVRCDECRRGFSNRREFNAHRAACDGLDENLAWHDSAVRIVDELRLSAARASIKFLVARMRNGSERLSVVLDDD
jgi:Zinc-finger of C2H2 type